MLFPVCAVDHAAGKLGRVQQKLELLGRLSSRLMKILSDTQCPGEAAHCPRTDAEQQQVLLS